MNTRNIAILQKIISDDYINTPILAKHLKLSKRSIRYSISMIREYLETENCELKYSNEKGYHFNKSDKLKVEILVNEFIRNQKIIGNFHERIFYLKGLLLVDDQFNVLDISQKMYIDRAIIIKDIKQIKAMWPEINYFNNRCTYQINKSEKLIKMCNLILNCANNKNDIYNHELMVTLFDYYSETKLLQIDKLVLNSSLNIKTKYLHFQVTWLSYYVLIGIKFDYNIDQDLIEIIKENVSLEIFNRFVNILESIGVEGLQIINLTKLEIKTEKFMNNVALKYGINFDKNNYAFDNLVRRINSVKLQLDLGIEYKYAEAERLIRLYPYSYSFAQQLLNVHQLINCSNEQVAYICESVQVLLFEAAIIKEIIIINDVYNAIISYYIEWIEYQYSKNVQIYYYNPIEFKAEKQNHRKIDLIINFSNAKKVTGDKIIHLNPVLSIENVNQIDCFLKKGNNNLRFMSNFINQGLLKVYLNPTKLDNVLEYVGAQLEKRKYITNQNKFVKGCLQREKISSTYVGFNTMIRHPLNYVAKRNAVHISVLQKPEHIDGNQVEIIITCAFEEKIDFEISRLFELLMKIIEQKLNRKLMVESQSEMDLFICLNNIITKL